MPTQLADFCPTWLMCGIQTMGQLYLYRTQIIMTAFITVQQW
jgi:hypothetical protein